MSGQHCENYDIKRETVHCYPWSVDHCCTWSEVAWCCPWTSQRVFQKFAFVLFCYITSHLITGPLENSEFAFLGTSHFQSVKYFTINTYYKVVPLSFIKLITIKFYCKVYKKHGKLHRKSEISQQLENKLYHWRNSSLWQRCENN